jgi:hypothetical protein
MTDETQLTGIAKKQAPRKKAGRKPGQKVYSQNQRLVALTIVDLFDGNVARAAQATGIERKSLFKWRDDLGLVAGEFQQVRTEGGADVVAVLNRLIEALCVIVLTKAQDASVKDLSILMCILLDKIENLTKLGLVQAAQSAFLPAAKKTEPEALTPSNDAHHVNKEKWEEIVRLVVYEAKAEGHYISREEAVAAVVKSNPEAAEYLM